MIIHQEDMSKTTKKDLKLSTKEEGCILIVRHFFWKQIHVYLSFLIQIAEICKKISEQVKLKPACSATETS